MDGQVNAVSEDALCSLLDRGVAWLEDFDAKLKNRAADLERKESDLAHRMSLAEQLEREFAERERQISDARAHADDFARRLADQEHALRTREQHERGEVRTLREQYDAKLRELEDRDAGLRRMEAELVNRRRAVEVCESAIARFQQTFERVLDSQPDADFSAASGAPRSVDSDSVVYAAVRDAGGISAERDLAARAHDSGSPTAACTSATESWGDWSPTAR